MVPKLNEGDMLGVVAPSGAVDAARLDPALGYLKERGFRVREGKHLYAQNRYLAGTDQERTSDLNAMMGDPEVRGIFVARGGYGSARILQFLDFDLVEKDPKVLVGFSDTTALQLGMFAQTGVITFTGVALCTDVGEGGMETTTEESLWSALLESRFEEVDGLQPLRVGDANGLLVGGCLSLVCSLLGTGYIPDLAGSILFLEDVNEPPYRVDRMLNQLLMAGVLARVGAVLFGRFEGCEPDSKTEGSVDDVLRDFAERVTCPVYSGLPYGHGVGRRVLPVGLSAKIESGTLVFDHVDA